MIGRRLPMEQWTAITLGVLVSADLVHWAAVLSSQASAHPVHAGPVLVATLRRAQHPDNLQTIVGAHLFGRAAATNPAGAASAAQSRRPLVLSGIMASEDPLAGRAIIAEQGRAAHVYRPGESLLGSYPGRVFQVLVDRVILDFGGQFEALTLPRHHLGGAGAPAAAVKTAAAELPTPEEPLPAEAARTTPTMAQAAFQPFHVRTGVGGGVQLYPEMRIQRQFGLHDGDVVTAVNGIAVAGSEALQEALRSAADTLSLTVVHNGVSQTVSVPVDE